MKINIMNELTRSFYKVEFKLKKHSPAILVTIGTAGVVASAVMACKATLKVNDILDEAKENIEKVHTVINNESKAEEYTLEDGKKDLTIVYMQTGFKLIKLYGPAVVLGTLSLTSILTSHRILSKRNVALAAAYTAVDRGFKDYRNRVVERFGEITDRELKNNAKFEETENVVIDSDGKEQTIKEAKFVLTSPSDISPYARFFGEHTTDEKGNVVKNDYWNDDAELNLVFLKQIERFCNERLKIKGFLFLNEVYEMIGLPKTKAGQVVGWIYNEQEPVGDNFVDFGLYKDNLSYSDFVEGHDPAILLDFNVDGNVWDMM